MTAAIPRPGFGYTIREYLGGGNWKSAYRASSPYRLADVALLFFHDDQPDIMAKDVGALIRTLSNHKFAAYLAEFHGIQRGEDGRVFIIEELLARPLERVAPLNDIVRFVQIARDLCRALTCLHSAGLVHRDLKLDNCGLDHHHRAKIFDLGSVTSEGGSVRGTIFTRAPELFEEGLDRHTDFAADIWSLGATLYALRSGSYPFVHRSEVGERHRINRAVRDGAISRERGQADKASIDEMVRQRIRRPEAEEQLRAGIHEMIRGRPEELLVSMMQFDRTQRRPIEKYEEEWSALAQELAAGQKAGNGHTAKWEAIKQHLALAERNELLLTRRQIERMIAEYQHDIQDDPDLEASLKRVKDAVAS